MIKISNLITKKLNKTQVVYTQRTIPRQTIIKFKNQKQVKITRWNTCTLKGEKHLWKKLKTTQINGKTFHVHGVEEQILLKYLCYPKRFTHLVQSLSKYQQNFHRIKINNPKTCKGPKKTLNSHSGLGTKTKWSITILYFKLYYKALVI